MRRARHSFLRKLQHQAYMWYVEQNPSYKQIPPQEKIKDYSSQPTTTQQTTNTNTKIAIVGAGIAGLSAALELRDFLSSNQGSNIQATIDIYESSNFAGGRMNSNTTDWGSPATSEWCGELIDSGHTTILNLASRFNLTIVDLINGQPSGTTDTYMINNNIYSYSQIVADFQPVYTILQNQNNLAPFPTTYDSFTQEGKGLDNMSVYDWIENYVSGGHKSNFGKLLDAAYNEEFGVITHNQSSLNVVYLLGFQPGTASDFNIYGVSDERYHIKEGNNALPQAILASLTPITNTAGTSTFTINYGSSLTKISVDNNNKINLVFNSANTSVCNNTLLYDQVILTMPFTRLRQIDYSGAGFDKIKNRAIQQLGYGANTKVSLLFKSRYWNTNKCLGSGTTNSNGPTLSSTGTVYTDTFSVWDTTRGLSTNSGILTYYSNVNTNLFNAQITPRLSTKTATGVEKAWLNSTISKVLANLETVYKGITQFYAGTGTVSNPTLDQNLLGSYSCWLRGQYTSFSGYEGVAQGVLNNIHFAGEHCSLSFQGYMEGGADEGIRAASEIIGIWNPSS